MNKVRTLIRISRPRFWLYLLGPFLVGSISSLPSLDNFYIFIFGFIFFLFPANIILYGINDLSDQDTDAHNLKKGSYEHKLAAFDLRNLKIAILISLVLAFFYFLILPFLSSVLFIGFMFLSWGYSALPLRFKSRPFIDSVSNILYVIPGFIAYSITTNSIPPIWIWISSGCWTISMHLFSAIPDIVADTKAGLKTTALVLGKNKSLLATAILWFCTSITIYFNTKNLLFALVMFVYVIIPIAIMKYRLNISEVYKLFPILNGFVGFFIFWYFTFLKYGFI